MDKTIFYIMGVSGCGKSTIGKLLAAELELPFFDGDDYHPQENIKKMQSGQALDDNDRNGWLKRLNTLASEHHKKGAVIACSALKERYRTILSHELKEKVSFIFLNGTFDEIHSRLKNRKGHFMPTALLQSQFETLEIPTEAIEVPVSLELKEQLKIILSALNK
ncbi:gluconokinase [Croceivirga thetidis]|uniref:Gluconokinase n=1 Tax=Croceivirga thetidis TaxID=2721623 RepID=A0ABX1GRJ8_9FLAO|nr:gluconokinase [Croceivirga thetidis]NKI32551.1 gluconokinase [Croceivirga thetidis]